MLQPRLVEPVNPAQGRNPRSSTPRQGPFVADQLGVVGLVGRGHEEPLAQPSSLRASGPHQPLDPAARDLDARAPELMPDLRDAVQATADRWSECNRTISSNSYASRTDLAGACSRIMVEVQDGSRWGSTCECARGGGYETPAKRASTACRRILAHVSMAK